MNRNSKLKNKPIEPKSMAQSQTVPAYIPQDDGRKSRCKLVTMMTKRSNHIPTSTIAEIASSTPGLVRTRFHHSACGTSTLHVINPQYANRYGPVARLTCVKMS